MEAPIPDEEFLVLLLVNYFREVKNTAGYHTGQVTPSASDATQLVRKFDWAFVGRVGNLANVQLLGREEELREVPRLVREGVPDDPTPRLPHHQLARHDDLHRLAGTLLWTGEADPYEQALSLHIYSLNFCQMDSGCSTAVEHTPA